MKSMSNAQRFSQHSKEWPNHFKRNWTHIDHVPWDQDIVLDDHQLEAISDSVATFQLGENAEGNTFKRSGKIYADQTGDQEYVGALGR